MSRPLNIGQAAAAAGLTAKMIRHYEQVGLLPAAARTDAGYRQYGERELAVLRFIRQSRQLGFSIEQTAGLLGLWADTGRTSREVKALARAHLDRIDRQMQALAQMQAALGRLVDACTGSHDPHCAILDGLAWHGTPSAAAPAGGASPLRPRGAGSSRAQARRRTAAAAPAAADAPHPLLQWAHAVHS